MNKMDFSDDSLMQVTSGELTRREFLEEDFHLAQVTSGELTKMGIPPSEYEFVPRYGNRRITIGGDE